MKIGKRFKLFSLVACAALFFSCDNKQKDPQHYSAEELITEKIRLETYFYWREY
jgi:hypothetical protein